MLKVRIVNKTTWQTKMLRPFVTRIAREEFSGTKPSNTRTRVTVEITYNKGKGFQYCSGYAYYNTSTAYVYVPNAKYTKHFPVLDFCHVVGHEFAHCKGVKHADMGLHYVRGDYSNKHYAWALTLPVPCPKPPKRAATTDEKRLRKLTLARAAVTRWTTKRKLAETKMKLWSRRVRAMERAIAKTEGVPE